MAREIVLQALADMQEAIKTNNWCPAKDKGKGGTGCHTNAIMGFTAVGGKEKGVRLYGCHNPIHTFQRADVLWSGWGYRCKPEAAELYFDWLLHRSPWSKQQVLMENIFPTKGVGFVIDGLDKIPANLMHNFLIATRIPSEWFNFVDSWYELVAIHKCNPELAFVFLTTFDPISDMTYGYGNSFMPGMESVYRNTNKSDWPLDIGMCTEEYVRNFMMAKIISPSDFTFYPQAQTLPINILWGKTNETNPSNRYPVILDTMYKKKYTMPPQRPIAPGNLGLSGAGDRYNLVYTPESLLEVLKEEEKRLAA